MTDPHQTLSPDHAEAVWRRAAQLQAEAARRLDERSRTLALAGESASPHPDHFTLDEVRTAAVEAGIAPEFVALAVVEVREEPESGLTPSQEAAMVRWLGTRQRRLEVSRSVDAPPTRVFDAMQRVLPGHPWYLSLRDRSGDPLAGGILVFDVPGVTEAPQGLLATHGMALELRQLRVMLRPAHGRSDACEIVVSAGLNRSLRRNTLAARIFSGTLGAMGAGGGVALAAAAGVGGALLALPAVAGLAVLGGTAAVGYGAGYRHSLRKLTEALERMLQAVDAHARTGGAFTPAIRPAAPGGDGGAATTAVVVASTIV